MGDVTRVEIEGDKIVLYDKVGFNMVVTFGQLGWVNGIVARTVKDQEDFKRPA